MYDFTQKRVDMNILACFVLINTKIPIFSSLLEFTYKEPN